MRRVLRILVTLAVISPLTLASDVDDGSRQLLESIEANDWTTALDRLQILAARDPKGFADKNLDYLQARVLEKAGRLSEAMADLERVADRHSTLSDYANVHLAQLARETGNLILERLYLYKLSKGPFANAAAERIARGDVETENFDDAIRMLTGGGPADSGQPGRELQQLLAEAYLHSHQIDQARPILLGLLDSMPNPAQADDVAQRAAKALDLIDDQGALSDAEHMRRGAIFQFNRDFSAAKIHFDAVIARPGSTSAPDALFQNGRAAAQQQDFVDALRWFERVLEQYPDAPASKDALLQAAACYSRVGKPKEAEKRYQQYIDKYPADARLDRAYLNTVDILRDHGSDQDALKWCEKTEEAFRGKVPEAVAIFAEARIFIAREEWVSALEQLDRLKTFSDLGGSSIPGGTNTAEVTFLKGFALEQLGRYSEAVDTYLSIPDGRGEYYGWRANDRLAALSQVEAGQAAVSQKLGSVLNELKSKDNEARRITAQSILRLSTNQDVRGQAIDALKLVIKVSPKYVLPAITNATTPMERDSAAEALKKLRLFDDALVGGSLDPSSSIRANRADRAMAAIEGPWKKVPADYPLELIPREQLRQLYPVVFTDRLLAYGPPRSLDPRLILSIMREESRFQPDVKSNAAARGLMQFISTTSTRIAGEVGRDRFAQDDLYQPDTAVLFGSQFVGDLFALFPQQPEAVIAAYNGGDDNVKRWMSRSRSGIPDRYVPEIMFTQTKEYVYRVMSNYRMYQYLYDENLRSR
ncbi:MAG: transglycosylase SLT domain-containing protein [Acidobacteria bacterium]|nr:transglycosylase SLT domain-containing protein [Acidobacteriota bacterium]